MGVVVVSGCGRRQWVWWSSVGVVVISGCGGRQWVWQCHGTTPFLSVPAVVPPAPTGVRVLTVTSTSLTLHWDTPLQASLVETYVIERMVAQGQWSVVGSTAGDRYFAMIQQLTPNTQYELRVVAQNQVGSRASEAITASTTHQGEWKEGGGH